MQYACQYIEEANGIIPWHLIDEVSLRDVSTGRSPSLATKARACWTSDCLYIRFECEDDHVVATMERHDDPLYMEDVVEVFIDEAGTGKHYCEIEVSPKNIVFDAWIKADANGSKNVDTAWHAAGMQTAVSVLPDGIRIYELQIPFHNFDQVPESGTSWRWNMYRIDDDVDGERHYSAWSPTGAINFHVPERFGTLVFKKDKYV